MRKLWSVAVLAMVVMLAASAAGALDNASTVRARQADKAAPDYATGKRAKLGGLVVLVNSAVVVEPDGSLELPSERTYKLEVRIENPTKKAARIPEAAIYCKDDDEAGDWFAQSTLSIGKELPAGTFDEGVFYLGLKDGCIAPKARFTINGVYHGRFPPAVDVRMP